LMDLQIPVYGTGRTAETGFCAGPLWGNRLCARPRRTRRDLQCRLRKRNGQHWNREEILSILGKDESLISFVEDRPGHDVRYSLDCSKIRTSLGWKPNTASKKQSKRLWPGMKQRKMVETIATKKFWAEHHGEFAIESENTRNWRRGASWTSICEIALRHHHVVHSVYSQHLPRYGTQVRMDITDKAALTTAFEKVNLKQ